MNEHVLTILAVRDLARSVAFWRAAFGWEIRVDAPVYVELALAGGRGLGLYVREGFARNVGDRLPVLAANDEIGGAEIYVRCADLAGVVARLEGLGARCLSPLARRPWGDEVAYYADPDGHVVAVARPI